MDLDRDEVNVADTDEVRYMQAEDKMVISIDVGNSFSSVTLAHLTWDVAPLSRSSSTSQSIRTVLTYPSSTPALTPIASRTPSLIYYDSDDQPRAHGAECLTAEAKYRAVEEGLTLVKGFKDQMRPITVDEPVSTQKESKKTLKRVRTSPHLTTPGNEEALQGAKSAKASKNPLTSTHSLTSMLSLSSIDSKTSLSNSDKSDGSEKSRKEKPERRVSSSSSKSDDKREIRSGPMLSDIWGDYLKYLIACARAYYSEHAFDGEATFDRLWSGCIFVIPHPADWSNSETDLIRDAMLKANLVPQESASERVVFVKDSVSTACFVQRHAEQEWLKEKESFVLCDAAELGVTIIGYRTSQIKPHLKLKPFDSITRLDAGVASVMKNFKAFLAQLLAKTKFKSTPIFTSTLLDEFQLKVIPNFGREAIESDIALRIVPEGMDNEVKGALGTDKGARIKGGWMTLTREDVESLLKPAVDSIVVRLSSLVSRCSARHIVLSGGFGEAPYLLSRLNETFARRGVSIVVSAIPVYTAVSEGALRYYLSKHLTPRKLTYNLGVEVAVDSTTQFAVIPHAHKRQVFHGSGGSKLITGKFSPIVKAGEIPNLHEPFDHDFHLCYRLASGVPPTFTTLLWAQDPDCREARDGWIFSPQGDIQSGFKPVCQVSANLESLVALADVHGQGKEAFVYLDITLAIVVGEFSLEAVVAWGEQVMGDVRTLHSIGTRFLVASKFFSPSHSGNGVGSYLKCPGSELVSSEIELLIMFPHLAFVLRRKTIKTLLLGPGESGKSTILKQLRLVYSRPYDDEERLSHREIVFSNTLQSMQVVLQGFETLDIDFPIKLDDSAALLDNLQVDSAIACGTGDFDVDVSAAIKAIWADPSTKKVIYHSNHFQLNDSATYFFNALARTAEAGYIPSDLDILRCRIRNTGIVEEIFQIGPTKLVVVDVGGQRSERRKWVSCFENVQLLIFVASVSEFDQVGHSLVAYVEPPLTQSLLLYSSLLSSPWFARTSLVLFLNKVDLLDWKVRFRPDLVEKYLPDCLGPLDDPEGVKRYFYERFTRIHQQDERIIGVHFTCATDTNSMRTIFHKVMDSVLKSSLAQDQLL
ncbi:uncharacterized protein JCM6883_004757 [Sporobolomyces salmoneus]|uniref:uncharacterized protein n=1 Tax=Sporobolomyces salmoneus TaxID=183962 RepID=UPI00317BF8B9